MTSPSKNDSTREITVEIEKVQNATIIEGDNFFEAELNLAIDRINDIYGHRNMGNEEKNSDKEKNRDKENNWFHQHNAIAVLGPRGVGKTSFILTLRDRIENCEKYNKYEKYNQYKDLKKKLIWLPILDPTRMEENEMFLVTVIANILKEIRKTNNELDFKVREEFQSLSRDFAVLASARVHEEQWKDLADDPDSFAYTVLNNAHSGISLVRSFHKFLGACKRALDNCNENTVFVQPIDDIDTAIEQGWPILETMRKYLATPHLIIIVTGDIDLYETLVRKQQLDKLSHLLENECRIGGNESRIGGNVRKIGDQIAQLTEQYLAKVIPSHLRIRLKSIADYITQEASYITQEASPSPPKKPPPSKQGSVYLNFDNRVKKPLSGIYNEFIKDLFGFHYSKEIEALSHRREISRLLPHITRDLVRFFKALKPWYYTYGTSKSVDEGEIEKTLEALVQIFNAALYAGDISPNDLLLLKEGRHLEWLGEYCLSARQKVQEFWRLFPRYDDEEWNYRALLLNAFLFQSWKASSKSKQDKKQSNLLYPHRPMSYGIKVMLPCLLADSRDLTGNHLLEMKRFLDIGNTERHFWMAVRSLAYRLRDSTDEWSKYGSGYVKVEGSEFAIKWENPLSWFCQFMYRPNNGKALYADILIALARLVDVLREGPDCETSELQNIFDLFIQDRVWYLHSVPQSKSTKGVQAPRELTTWSDLPMRTESKADHVPTPKNDQSKDEIASKMMKRWIDDMRELDSKKILTPPLIARIWKRFIDNLEYIRSDIEKKDNIGEKDNNVNLIGVLKCWVKAFLNASLIEEVIFWCGVTEHNINIENIRLDTDNDVFFRNLEKLKPDFDTIYYTKAWIACPLFWLFLTDMPNEIKEMIIKPPPSQ